MLVHRGSHGLSLLLGLLACPSIYDVITWIYNYKMINLDYESDGGNI
jgi:hypothetical protein